MKKTILLLFISVLFTCNDESSDDNNSENTTIENDINCSGDYSTDGVLLILMKKYIIMMNQLIITVYIPGHQMKPKEF